MQRFLKFFFLLHRKAEWEHMAQLCVKNLRLDVARVCLARLGNARALKALREVEAEPELQAQVAMLATHLGMLVRCERYYFIVLQCIPLYIQCANMLRWRNHHQKKNQKKYMKSTVIL